MSRKNVIWIIQVLVVVGLYYILSTYITNLYLLLGIFVVAGIVIILIRSIFIHNDSDILEVLVHPDKHFDYIMKYKDKDENRYNLLYAYGLTYIGKFDEALEAINKVQYDDIKTSANLHYDYHVTKLHLAYNNKDRGGYKESYDFANSFNVFQKVDIPKEAFEAHLLLLSGYSDQAEELLKKIIPKIRKRILIVELEYILALAYFNQNKMEDCKAVCEFIVEKKHPVVYTTLCEELLTKVK